MSNLNPNNEHDAMSDARLDELLDLANPKLDPVRQTSLKRTVGKILKSNRPTRWMLFQTNVFVTRPAAIVSLVLTSFLVVLVGLGWFANPDSNRPTRVADFGTSELDALPSPKMLSGSELARRYPPIFSTSSSVRSNSNNSSSLGPNKTSQQQNANFRPSTFVALSRKRVLDLSDSVVSQIETTLLTIAGTDSGLMLLGRFANELDHAAGKVATDQRALPHSNARRSRKAEGLLELEQPNMRLRFARHQLESYLADAVERLPDEQATLAFRVLCRIGSKSSLPMILKYRNVTSTKTDAGLAISKLADVRTLGQLVLETSDADLQSQLMAGLLCRHDADSLDLFLELTAKYDLYSTAQKSGGIAGCVPTEMLLQRLRSNRTRIARAAAITMSGMNDPNITEYLLQLAKRPESHHQAVMALTARTDDSAVQFVQLASNDARWSATVVNEQKKWSRILALN